MKIFKKIKFKQYIKILSISLIFIILLPTITALLVSIHIIDINTNNDWIGFYGSYLGSILGGIVTLFGIKITLENEKNKEQIKKQEQIMPNIVLRLKPCLNSNSNEYLNVEVISMGEGNAYNAKLYYFKNKIYSIGTLIKDERFTFTIDTDSNIYSSEFILEFSDVKNSTYRQIYTPFIDKSLKNNEYIQLYGSSPKIFKPNRFDGLLIITLTPETLVKDDYLDRYKEYINNYFINRDFPIFLQNITLDNNICIKLRFKLTRDFPIQLIKKPIENYFNTTDINLEIVEGDVKLI